jgi:hypothetical protein
VRQLLSSLLATETLVAPSGIHYLERAASA